MSLRFYAYAGCETCRRARKWLVLHELDFTEIPIRDQPPTEAELEAMLSAYDGQLKRLFNTSSRDYREAGLKDRIDQLSPEEAFTLLRSQGNLVKRPFLIGPDTARVGFDANAWAEALGR